ncbi:MAG: hypothetical protein AABY03_02420 [Nanoarchaeota archaeon]
MEKKYKVNGKDLVLDVIITQEKIDNKLFFIAQGIQLDVASQGLSLDEALENIKDAADIVLESSQEKKKRIEEERKETPPMLTRIFL